MRAVLLRDLRLAMRVGGGFGLAIMFFLIVAVLVPLGVGHRTRPFVATKNGRMRGV